MHIQKNVTADALSNVSIAFLKSYVENSIYEDQQKSKPENYGLLLYRKKKAECDRWIVICVDPMSIY
jgi:hypothetical protein